MDTLKQLQEKGEVEFRNKFVKTQGLLQTEPIIYGTSPKVDDVLDFLHQQTTLAFEAGKAEMLDTVLKEIDGHCVDEDNLNANYVFGFNQALDTLKNRLKYE